MTVRTDFTSEEGRHWNPPTTKVLAAGTVQPEHSLLPSPALSCPLSLLRGVQFVSAT